MTIGGDPPPWSREEDRETQTEPKCKWAPGFLSSRCLCEGDAPENSTQQRLLLVINAAGKQGQNSKGLIRGRSTDVGSRGLCPWGFRTRVTPSACRDLGGGTRWGGCGGGGSWGPCMLVPRSSWCLPPADTGEGQVPSFSPSRGVSDLSPFTASATHGILELEHLSQTHRRFHTVFESQNLSIWSLSQNPRILESQDHLWTHGPESRRIKESLEKTWSLTHSLLDPWNRSINSDKPGIETVTLKSEP